MSPRGLHRIEEHRSLRFLYIDSDDLKGGLDVFREYELDGIAVSPLGEYKLPDVEFLREVPGLKAFLAAYAGKIDLSAVTACHSLESLTLHENKQPLDISNLRKLKYLSVDWHSALRLPQRECLKHLGELDIDGYKGRSLDAVPAYRNLRRLVLTNSPIRGLHGIENFLGLRRLRLVYCTKLKTIEGIEHLTDLSELQIEVCRQVDNWSLLGACFNLRSLWMFDCGNIQNIAFVRQLPRLKDFRFMGTNVVDGDLSPCQGIKEVICDNKRHYSPTEKQLKGGRRL
jgi:protein phosphatase 1 regulatory subunit 7